VVHDEAVTMTNEQVFFLLKEGATRGDLLQECIHEKHTWVCVILSREEVPRNNPKRTAGRRAIPWNYSPFLDYAAERILLRKVATSSSTACCWSILLR
jgi:hypothetical protein